MYSLFCHAVHSCGATECSMSCRSAGAACCASTSARPFACVAQRAVGVRDRSPLERRAGIARDRVVTARRLLGVRATWLAADVRSPPALRALHANEGSCSSRAHHVRPQAMRSSAAALLLGLIRACGCYGPDDPETMRTERSPVGGRRERREGRGASCVRRGGPGSAVVLYWRAAMCPCQHYCKP